MNIVSNKYNNFIIIVSLFVALLGISVVFSWILNMTFPEILLPGYVPMKFNTALCFILISTSLFLQIITNNKFWHRLHTLFFLLTLICGILSLSQGIFNYNLGIDQLFLTDLEAIESNQPYPGRMSPLTAICFILIALAFSGIKSKNQKILILAQFLLHLITIASFIAILGYLFNVSEFYKLSFLTSMAVHTAIAFFMLSIAASLINPTLGITGLFTGNKIGNTIARKLFLQILIAILILTYLHLLSDKHMIVSVDFGIALSSVSFILISLFLIWRASYELNNIDTKKAKAEDMLSDIKIFLDSTPDPIVIIDEKGTIQLINTQTENVLGFEKEELIGQEIEILMPARFQKSHKENRENFFHSPKTRNMGTGQELFAIKKDGREIPVEISLSPIKMQNGTWVSASIRDISARKAIEEQLSKVSERLMLATQSSSVGIWDYDIVNNILVWDDIMFELYGIKRENFSGAYDAWKKSLHADDLERGDKEIQLAIKGEKEFDTEFKVTWPDESIHIIKAKATVQRDKAGNALRMLGTNWDITEQKNVEEKIKQYAILEAKSKEMEQFSYIASHDLRHPLLTIQNYIKIFDEDYADILDAEAKYCLRSISDAANRMDKLIFGILDYSRLSKIKTLEIVDCNEIIHNVLADLNSTIKTANAKIIVNDLPTLNAYPLELRQLFQNLITNALKFKRMGIIPELTVLATKNKDGYCFEFRDNGIGIEAKDIGKLFMIFQRLHTAEEYEGTGLGLAYCKKIVELHRGKIWVESKPGQGSSFYFTINT